MSLKLDWVAAKAARFAVEHWHYSRTAPVGKSVKVGVWESGVFKGVVMFGLGAMALHRRYRLEATEVCELTRVALRSHDAPVSQIVAAALCKLREACPGMRLVVSFADTQQGHAGIIYQAGNWTYTGLSAATNIWITREGKQLHIRSYSGVNFGRPRQKLPPGAVKGRAPGKHRYVYPLDKRTRRLIKRLGLATPYPKLATTA